MKTTTTVATSGTKFKTLTLMGNGILIGYGNSEETCIYFSELDKIYIKSYTLDPVIQFIFILFLFIPLAVDYFPFYLALLTVLFTVVPVFMKAHNYKWYQMMYVQIGMRILIRMR